MKRSSEILAVVALSLILVGCSSVQTTVKNSDTVLFKVGSTTITKGSVYEEIKNSDGADYTIDEIKEKIEDAEITSDKKVATYVDKLYQKYVDAYTDEESFITQLTNYGYADADDFKENQLKSEAKEDLLEQKYLKIKKSKYFKKYQPSIVRVMTLEKKKKAEEALERLNNGESWDDIYTEYTTDDGTYSNEDTILTTSSSGFKENDIKEIYKTNAVGLINKIYKTTVNGSTTRYLVQIISTNRTSDDYFGDITTEVSNNDTDFSTNMWTYYMKKHNFTVYDQDIFDYLRENNPEYLHQYPELKEKKSESTSTTTTY